jgi:hypothetical protein
MCRVNVSVIATGKVMQAGSYPRMACFCCWFCSLERVKTACMKKFDEFQGISAIVGSAVRKMARKVVKINYYTFNSTSGNKYAA